MSVTNNYVGIPVYGTTNDNTTTALSARRERPYCTRRRKCSIAAVIVGALLLVSGGVYFGVKNSCKTVTCATTGPQGYGCDCLDNEQYAAYNNGTLACSPCKRAPVPPRP